MAKKKIQKKKTRITLAPLRRSLFALASLCLSVFFITSIISDIFVSIDLQEGIHKASKQKEELAAEVEHYETLAERLSNNNYVAHYARIEYEMAKKGETLFRLPQLNKDKK